MTSFCMFYKFDPLGLYLVQHMLYIVTTDTDKVKFSIRSSFQVFSKEDIEHKYFIFGVQTFLQKVATQNVYVLKCQSTWLDVGRFDQNLAVRISCQKIVTFLNLSFAYYSLSFSLFVLAKCFTNVKFVEFLPPSFGRRLLSHNLAKE